MSSEPDFLLVRGADLLILGIRWSGFDLHQEKSGSRLVATAEGEHVVTLFFPPQSIAEEKYSTEDDTVLRGARLAGSSRVAFTVPTGTEIALDIDGVLEALTKGQVVSPGDGISTVVELPWHLSIAPVALSGAAVVSAHEAKLVESTAGAVGLWDARLRAEDGSATDAGLAVLPLPHDGVDEDPLDIQPLSDDQRQIIRDTANRADMSTLAHARRLELSALGGSFSARLQTPAVDWDHDTTLGRDQRVRFSLRGVLFPFGHRAVYVETAERRFGSGSPTRAGMHRKELLIITEPVRSTADGDTALTRKFPFSEVEILQRSFTEIDPADFVKIKHVAKSDQDLTDQVSQGQNEMAEIRSNFEAEFAEVARTLDEYIGRIIEQETPTGVALSDAIVKEARNADDILKFREDGRQEIKRLWSMVPVDPPEKPVEFIDPFAPPVEAEPPAEDDELIDGIEAQVRQIEENIAGLTDGFIAQVRSEEGFWDQRVVELRATAQAELESFDTLDEFIVARVSVSEEAQRFVGLGPRIAALELQIQQIHEQADVLTPAYWMPLAHGEPMRFPLRCAGAAGDVFFSVPLVFVRDQELPESDHFERLAFLTDPGVRGEVEALWNTATGEGTIPLPGARIDMIRSGEPSPPPGDVHEVHALSLLGVPHEGGFRPQLSGFTVELPALRGLLPGVSSRQALKYADTFLDNPHIPEMPLELANPLDIDFRTAADRSGGLVSPKFFADKISRTLGPIAAEALPPALMGVLPDQPPPFDPKSVFKDATLLGFPLASLIKLPPDPLAALPLPPAIVQLFENGLPNGMKMDWTLDLDEHGPFKPGANTKLVLSVLQTLAKHETTCTVNDFRLVLPPDGKEDGLLTLSFESLIFTQSQGQPPKLDIKGLKVGFGGALKLVQELAAELEKVIGLPDNLPRVDISPSGVKAGYGISAPSVTAGAFLITNIAMHAGVDVPFDGKPVTVSVSFATRENPFNVTVMAFGGGGYLDLTMGPKGIERLEASIDFGAHLEVDFFVARGEVHALGGVRFKQIGDSMEIDGFVDIGGSVEVLGLVSVSITLLVTLSYRDGNRLVGSATLVIELDLTLFSESVEIDSGEWVLAGSEATHAERDLGPGAPIFDRDLGPAVPVADREAGAGVPVAAREDPLESWKRYREAFVSA